MLFWVADGGGTKTEGVIADDHGHVFARQIGAPCNLTLLGPDACERNLNELLSALCAAAHVQRSDLTHAFLALGGLDTEADRLQFASIISPLFHGCTVEWQVENDVLAALYSGTWGKPGLVLLAGTGSMAMAQDAHGRIKRAGGWGYMIGRDPGSAFDVGQRFLMHALREYDAGHQPDELTRLVMHQVGVAQPPDLMDWVESAESRASRVAQCARFVDMSAVGGNAVAAGMLQKAAKAMVDHFCLLAPQLDFGDIERVPVVLAGSMFKSQTYRTTVQQLVAVAGKRWQAVLPEVPPVGGAYVGALQMAGISVTADIMRSFTRTIQLQLAN